MSQAACNSFQAGIDGQESVADDRASMIDSPKYRTDLALVSLSKPAGKVEACAGTLVTDDTWNAFRASDTPGLKRTSYCRQLVRRPVPSRLDPVTRAFGPSVGVTAAARLPSKPGFLLTTISWVSRPRV